MVGPALSTSSQLKAKISLGMRLSDDTDQLVVFNNKPKLVKEPISNLSTMGHSWDDHEVAKIYNHIIRGCNSCQYDRAKHHLHLSPTVTRRFYCDNCFLDEATYIKTKFWHPPAEAENGDTFAMIGLVLLLSLVICIIVLDLITIHRILPLMPCCKSFFVARGFASFLFFSKLLGHLVVLFKGLLKPEACWSGMRLVGMRLRLVGAVGARIDLRSSFSRWSLRMTRLRTQHPLIWS